MNLFLQLALACVPAFIILLIYTIIKRKSFKHNIFGIIKIVLGFIIVISMGTTCTVFGFNNYELKKANNIIGADYTKIVYGIVENDDEVALALSRSMIDKYYETQTVSSELVLCNARVSALEGNYKKAHSLYQKVDDQSKIKKELDVAAQLIANPENDDRKVFIDAVKSELKSSNSDVQEISDIIYETNKLYNSSEIDTDKVSQLIHKANKLVEDHPELSQVDDVRECRVQLNLLDKNYEEIAKNIDDNASFDEIVVASELHIDGLIDDSDYNDAYSQAYNDKREVVGDVLKELLNNNDLTQTQKDSIQKTLDNYETLDEYKSLGHNLIGLAEHTSNPNGTNKSKAYLEMSKIEYALENNDLSEHYFDEALNNISSCDDDNFSAPINEIAGLIRDNDNPEALKNVADYVEQSNRALSEMLSNPNVAQGINEATSDSNYDENENEDLENENGTSGSKSDDYVSYYRDYVSMKNASLNITRIDTSNFETVTATFNIDSDYAYSAEELQKCLEVYDCGEKIENFTIEKKTYAGENVILVCDVSGSMSGDPIEDLKSSVTEFLNTSTDDEKIGIIAFDSDPVDEYSYRLGSSKFEMINGVSEYGPRGGTNMYDPTIAAMNDLPNSNDYINFVILLSDGEDNEPKSDMEIYQTFSELSLNNGATIYSLGLGSNADGDYLSSFSSATGGEYLYVTDSATLSAFYQMLRNQVKNQYEIKFDAVDTLTTFERDLQININTDSLCTDTKTYSLEGATEDDAKFDRGLCVNGFDTKVLISPKSGTTIKLKGSGFTDKNKVSIKLKGNQNYYINDIKYVDENTFEFTLPDKIANSVYDAYVTIDGKRKILREELTIANKIKTLKFGQYVFKSFEQSTDTGTNTTKLSGAVIMNDWLRFSGTVTLVGDIKNGSEAVMSTSSTMSVLFNEETATGQAIKFAKEGKPVIIPQITDLTLYNDYTDTAGHEYTVDRKELSQGLLLSGLFFVDIPTVSLYPDKLYVDMNGLTYKFPMLEKLVNVAQSKLGQSIWDFDITSDMEINSTSIGAVIETTVTLKSQGERSTKHGKIGNALDLGIDEDSSARIKIDTKKCEYEVELSVNLPSFLIGHERLNADGKTTHKDTDLGLSLLVGLKTNEDYTDIILSKAQIGADFPIDAMVSGVPVTFSDFKLAMEEIDEVIKTGNPLKGSFIGSFDAAVSCDKLKKVPVADGIKDTLNKYFGDMTLIKLNDSTVTIKLSEIYISFESEFQLLGKKVGAIEVELGNLKYTNELLGFNEEAAYGIVARIKDLGINVESGPIDLNATVSGELSLTHRYIGITVGGNLSASVRLWIFQKNLGPVKGDLTLGLLPFGNDTADGFSFALNYKYRNGNKSKGHYWYLSVKSGSISGRL